MRKRIMGAVKEHPEALKEAYDFGKKVVTIEYRCFVEKQSS